MTNSIATKASIIYRALSANERRALPGVKTETVAALVDAIWPHIAGTDTHKVAWTLQYRCSGMLTA